MKEKIHIYSGPIIYRNYFLYNNRMFIIDANKNFFFIAFPFLMFLFPIRCYEVVRDTVEFSKKRKNTILFPIIAVNSAFLENIVSYMVINVSISPYISIIFAIATAFLIRTKIEKLNVKIVKSHKIRIIPTDFMDVAIYSFVYICLWGFIVGVTIILFNNPNNIFWFMGELLCFWLLFASGENFIRGNAKVKFLS